MKIFSLLVSLILLISCTSKQEYNDPLIDFDQFERITSNPIQSSDSIFKANDIILIGDYLIVNDPELDYIYKIINISSDTFVKKFGKRGEGPCELPPMSFINRVGDVGYSLGIYSGLNQRYQEYDFKEVLAGESDPLCLEITYRFEKFHLKFAKIDSRYSLAYGMYDQPYALILDNKVIQNIGDFPFKNQFSNIPNEVLAMAYQPTLIKHPTDSRVLSTATYSFDMDFLELKDNHELEVYKKLHYWPPDFEDPSVPGEFSAAIKEENRFGNVSTTVSENYIYVLYSDKPWEYQYPLKSKKVLLYDWEGNAVRILELDQEVSLIAAHEKDKFLIGYADDGKANLYRFDLD